MISNEIFHAQPSQAHVSDAEIRRLAYQLWEQSGCPAGDDWTHWFAAESHLRANLVTHGEAAQHKNHPSSKVSRETASAEPLPGSAGHHDRRTDVAASGRMQRRRARQAGG